MTARVETVCLFDEQKKFLFEINDLKNLKSNGEKISGWRLLLRTSFRVT